MTRNKLTAKNRLYYQIAVTVSKEEIDLIDSLVKTLGFQSRGQLLRTALEHLTNTKIFRQRDTTGKKPQTP